jgi:SAM-dependent methyltransferase
MSSILNKNYVNITYKSNKTDYPKKFVSHLIDKFKIKKDIKLLDIGCGNGLLTKNFIDNGVDAYGIDISLSSHQHLPTEKFKKHDLSIRNYPFDDETFDVIFSKSVVEHLRDPDILIDESFRLLKPGGILICMTPSWFHSYKEAFYIDHTHVTPFTRVSMETICELSGFKSECSYFYQLPLLWKYPVLNIFRFLIQKLPIPYAPFNKVLWGDKTNKIIRFSKEAMLICKAEKK